MNTIELLLAVILAGFGLLTTATLGIAGWTLLEVVSLGKSFERMSQKVRDLPCVTNGTKPKCE